MKTNNSHKPGSDKGQTLVEFVLLLPIIILLVFGLFDFGRIVYYKSVLTNAAREGARYGSTDPSSTSSIEAAVERHLYGIRPEDITIEIVDTGPTTNNIRVTVSYNFLPATPVITTFINSEDDELTLSSQSLMRIER